MIVTTEHHIVGVPPHEQRGHAVNWGTLFVLIFIDGDLVYTVPIMTGPRSDIKSFVDGERSMNSVKRAWALIGVGRLGST